MPLHVSHNLFFALWPDDDVRAGIEAAARDLRARYPGGRWIKSHRYHLTLRFLGGHARRPDELIALASAAGDRVRASSFEFALDVAGSFRNRSMPWWLGCHSTPEPLGALWGAIDAELAPGGDSDSGVRQRIPHVTVVRDADRVLKPTPIAPIAWPVGEFVLVHSQLGADSRYTVVRRWPLSS